MELVELVLHNFKKFAKARFGFSEGISVFFGPNESGKSTILEGIYCALFGRLQGATLESWTGGPCSVEMLYRTSGKLYRIERRLTEGNSRLGVVTNEGLTGILLVNDEIDQTIAAHLGIASREVFENTVGVKQAHLSSITTSDMESVGAEIQRTLTGTSQVSATKALKKLENKLHSIKGRARPANPREYDIISGRLREAEKLLHEARDSRTRISQLEDEISKLEVRIASDTTRLEFLEELLKRHSRWSELKQQETEKESRHKTVFATLQKLKKALEDLKEVQKKLEHYTDLVGKDEEILEHLRKIESKRVELQERIEYLSLGATNSPRLIGNLFLAGAVVIAIIGIVLGFTIEPSFFMLLGIALVVAILHSLVLGRWRGRHIVALLDAARAELKQLDDEEATVLHYVNCRTAAEARMRIENYRALVTKVHELELTIGAILGDSKLEDVEEEEASLSRELSTIRRELKEEFEGYAPTTEEAESWRVEYTNLLDIVQASEYDLHKARGAIESERQNSRDLANLEGEVAFLQTRRKELDFLHRACELAIRTLSTVIQTVSEEYLPTISNRATEYLKTITSGRYTRVFIKPNWETILDCTEKHEVSTDVLSVGTVDQLYLVLRIACGELLSGGRGLPVLLDDPFVAFDDQRLHNALRLLEILSRDQQIVLFTHDVRVLQWAKGLSRKGDFPIVIEELEGPAITKAVEATSHMQR